MILPRFDPPAFLNDLATPQKAAWSRFISDSIDADIAEYAGDNFYNPTRKDTAADAQEKIINWTAFPRIVTISSSNDRQRWQRADASRDVQDEYCEWSVTRNSSGKITRVSFTCEGPEYWEFLASVNQAKVLELYQSLISPSVQASDLFTSDGQYITRNQWNTSTTGGAMHLVQGANTLLAQINIAIRSTIVRKIGGSVLTQPQELIDCGRYGDGDRHSDPHIGAEVNALARLKADICLANPVGLYLEGLFPVGWATPDGSDPLDYWTAIRGTATHTLRAVYEVPTSKTFVVGDITINGDPVEFGGQIADFIRVKLTGVACRFGQSIVPPQSTCEGSFTPFMAKSGANVRDALQRAAMRKHR